MWFIPGKGSRHGCAYVGFGNQWAQGGVNSAGLAFDWVAGNKTAWKRAPELKTPRGNSAERMLERCATVDEAIAFYRSHWEPDFARSWILIADRTGASVIIGARDEALDVQKRNDCRGFGYGYPILTRMLTQETPPTFPAASEILIATRASGQYATKYSSVYDLVSGDIYLLPVPGNNDVVVLNLTRELNKGRHRYDLPKIREQLTQPLRRPSRFKEWAKIVACWFRK